MRNASRDDVIREVEGERGRRWRRVVARRMGKDCLAPTCRTRRWPARNQPHAITLCAEWMQG